MSLIDQRIIEELCEWAMCHENSRIFDERFQHKDSYYIDRDCEDTYIMEYSIQSVEALKKVLQKYTGLSEDSEMLKRLTVEIFKNRPRNEWKEKTDRKDITKIEETENILPEFIYVF